MKIEARKVVITISVEVWLPVENDGSSLTQAIESAEERVAEAMADYGEDMLTPTADDESSLAIGHEVSLGEPQIIDIEEDEDA